MIFISSIDSPAFAAQSVNVNISPSSSAPGCEVTNSCFIPYQITVDSGGEVTWTNYDSAAHTVTSGTAKDGLDGNFDSSLFMPGTTFSHTFDHAGTYPYICMVHPWMTGEVIVIGTSPSPPPPPPAGTNVVIQSGSSVPSGPLHFSPSSLSIDVSDTIKWYNADTATHTITSGYPSSGPDGKFDSSLIMSGQTFSHKFTNSGSYPYFCMVHPWMTAEINVKSSAPPTPTGPPITVSTEKTSYKDGETIIISGKVLERLSGTPVMVQVFATNGNLVTLQSLDVSYDNKFRTEISVGGALWKSKGTYTVKALYGTQSRTAETTFQFSGSIDYGLINTIKVDTTNFALSYKITGGSILNVTPDNEANSLVIPIRTITDGQLTITLPRALIDAKTNGYDKSFFVLVDGEEVQFKETATSTDRTLTIAFPDGAEEIEILGSFISSNSISTNTFKSYADTGSTGPTNPSQIYSINVIDTKYSIDYRTSSGRILSASAIDELNSIILRFDTLREGQITVTLPRLLIDSKINGRDDNFFVLLDGEEVDFDETKTSYARTLIIPFSASTNQIEILGSIVNVNKPTPPQVTIPIAYPAPSKPGSDVILTSGSSVPGCEVANSCFTPYQLKINSGDEVTWYNADSAAHTVTSGTGKDGPDGNFDSSLFMAGTTFSVKFDNYRSGIYPYFCMVHPWMTGEVVVGNSDLPYPNQDPKPVVPPSPPANTDVILRDGSSVPGCEETNSCFIPSTLYVNSGDNVVWFNQDSAAHTVTSGNPQDGPSGNFDSSLFMPGTTFSHTFDNAGTYPYFCMVHPWMIGYVKVSGSETSPQVPQPVPNTPPPQNSDDLSKIIEENKKLREELDRQGEQINDLNQQVDYLSEIINSIKGFFGNIFS